MVVAAPAPNFEACSLHMKVVWHVLDPGCHQMFCDYEGTLIIREWGNHGEGWYTTSDNAPLHFLVDPQCNGYMGERRVVVGPSGTDLYQIGTPNCDSLRDWFDIDVNCRWLFHHAASDSVDVSEWPCLAYVAYESDDFKRPSHSPKTLRTHTGRLRQRVGRPLWSHFLLYSSVGDPGTAV